MRASTACNLLHESAWVAARGHLTTQIEDVDLELVPTVGGVAASMVVLSRRVILK